jgi:hypothetical protein
MELSSWKARAGLDQRATSPRPSQSQSHPRSTFLAVGVAAGGTGVGVSGIGVAVGGIGVAVGSGVSGIGVVVASTGLGVGVASTGVGPSVQAVSDRIITSVTSNSHSLFLLIVKPPFDGQANFG